MTDGNDILSDDELQTVLSEAASEIGDAIATIDARPDTKSQPSETAAVDATLDAIDEDLSELQTILADESAEAEDENTAAEPESDATDESTSPQSGEATADDEDTSPEPAPGKGFIVKHLKHLPGTGLALTQRGLVAALSGLDRPFHNVSPPVKNVAGYTALATCVVATITWVFALYRA